VQQVAQALRERQTDTPTGDALNLLGVQDYLNSKLIKPFSYG